MALESSQDLRCMIKSLMRTRIRAVREHAFFTYSWVGAVFTFLNIVLVWVFIDLWHIPTLISSTIVVGGLFVGKYYAYKWSGLIEYQRMSRSGAKSVQ